MQTITELIEYYYAIITPQIYKTDSTMKIAISIKSTINIKGREIARLMKTMHCFKCSYEQEWNCDLEEGKILAYNKLELESTIEISGSDQVKGRIAFINIILINVVRVFKFMRILVFIINMILIQKEDVVQKAWETNGSIIELRKLEKTDLSKTTEGNTSHEEYLIASSCIRMFKDKL